MTITQGTAESPIFLPAFLFFLSLFALLPNAQFLAPLRPFTPLPLSLTAAENPAALVASLVI